MQRSFRAPAEGDQKSMNPSSGPLHGPRHERWQERSQASRLGRQASGLAEPTQYSIFQVHSALQPRQQESEAQTDAARLPCGYGV